MKALIVYASPHHGNTWKVAEAMARPLQADLVDVTKEPLPELSGYDFVGFASGIYFQKFHKRVEECLKAAAFSKEQRVFLVATCGAPLGNYTWKLEKKLEQKGSPCGGRFSVQGVRHLRDLRQGGRHRQGPSQCQGFGKGRTICREVDGAGSEKIEDSGRTLQKSLANLT